VYKQELHVWMRGELNNEGRKPAVQKEEKQGTLQ